LEKDTQLGSIFFWVSRRS